MTRVANRYVERLLLNRESVDRDATMTYDRSFADVSESAVMGGAFQ